MRRVLRPRADPGRRLGITLLAIAFLISLFAGRLVQLQGFQSSTYKRLAQDQRLKTKGVPAVRGTITAANGQVLAKTLETYLVYADPMEMTTAEMPEVPGPARDPAGHGLRHAAEPPASPPHVAVRGAEEGREPGRGNQIKA